MTEPSAARTPPRVLVVGTGSIGGRHINNLLSLGSDVSTYSYRTATEAAEWRGRVRAFDRLDEALDAAPDAVVVANRTEQHMEVAAAAVQVARGLFIEKPLSNSLRGVAALVRCAEVRQVVVEAGFMLRWHPNLVWIKALLEREGLGELHYARAGVGQYLPDWRPGRDYRESYSAKRAGGGVIFDLVHEVDLIGWLFGPIEEVHAMTRFVPSLEIESEAIAQIGLRCGSGVLAQVHLDYVRPVYGRTLEIVGSRGVLVWDYAAGSVSLTSSTGTTVGHQLPATYERNDMFLCHMQHFLERLSDPRRAAVSSLADAVAALRTALACHQSSIERRLVRPLDVTEDFSLSAV